MIEEIGEFYIVKIGETVDKCKEEELERAGEWESGCANNRNRFVSLF